MLTSVKNLASAKNIWVRKISARPKNARATKNPPRGQNDESEWRHLLMMTSFTHDDVIHSWWRLSLMMTSSSKERESPSKFCPMFAGWGLLIIKRNMSWFKNAIAKLYNVVSAPVAATRDALSKRLRDIRNKVTNLYNKARGRQSQKTRRNRGR